MSYTSMVATPSRSYYVTTPGRYTGTAASYIFAWELRHSFQPYVTSPSITCLLANNSPHLLSEYSIFYKSHLARIRQKFILPPWRLLSALTSSKAVDFIASKHYRRNSFNSPPLNLATLHFVSHNMLVRTTTILQNEYFFHTLAPDSSGLYTET